MRKQRKPKIARQSGTEYKTHTEMHQVKRKWQSKIIPSHGTRKKPLLLTGKVVEKGDESATKKTDERMGFDSSTNEEKKEE